MKGWGYSFQNWKRGKKVSVYQLNSGSEACPVELLFLLCLYYDLYFKKLNIKNRIQNGHEQIKNLCLKW